MKTRNVLAMVSPMCTQRVNGIARYALEHGWNLMLQDRLGHTPLAWHGDGIIATLRSDALSIRCIEEMMKRGIPIVDLTISRPEIKVPRVMSDHAEIGRIAARHFLEREFRHFAWFSTAWGNVHRLRLQGFSELATETPHKWILANELPPSEQGNWDAVVRWVGGKISSVEHPIAVLTYDETDAARLLYAAKELGISVPEQLAILSIGNNSIVCENQSIPLSSIDQNLERGGYEAAALLNRLMSRKKPARHDRDIQILIPPKGVVPRRSTDVIAVSDPTLSKALAFIQHNLSRSIGSPQVADALSVPRLRIDRLFRSELSRSVGEEIRRQRLALAKILLETSAHSVGTIARLTGFCTPSHLNNVFHKATGLTPRAWRVAHTKNAPPTM